MMPLALDIALFAVLGILLWQDWKQRAIHWVWIVALFALITSKTWMHIGTTEMLEAGALNLGFLALQAIALTLWFSLKNKRLVNILKGHLGLGDVLFFIALSAAFAPLNFILFFVIGSFFVLLVHVLYLLLAKKPNKLIPLAGSLSGALMICLVLQHFELMPDFYESAWIGMIP